MAPIKGDLLEVDNVVLGVEIRTPDDDYRFDADTLPHIPGYPASEVLKDLAVMGTECARGERECFTAFTQAGVVHIPSRIIKTVFIEFSRPTSDILRELSGDDAP